MSSVTLAVRKPINKNRPHCLSVTPWQREPVFFLNRGKKMNEEQAVQELAYILTLDIPDESKLLMSGLLSCWGFRNWWVISLIIWNDQADAAGPLVEAGFIEMENDPKPRFGLGKYFHKYLDTSAASGPNVDA